MDTAEFCREIEAYLCRKNDGHLIRVVGPSFELVTRWAETGVPLAIAYRGIDRYVERYYRKGPRRRPVRIEFCEADVLEVFDEWRRALGLPAAVQASTAASPDEAASAAVAPGETAVHGRGASLPAHLERAILRLTDARAAGRLTADADAFIDRVARELDAVRAVRGGLRGDARRETVARLATLDAEIVALARQQLGAGTCAAIERDASSELQPFRDRLSDAAYRRALDAATDRLARERLGLPTIAFL